MCGRTVSPAKLRHRLKHARKQHIRPNSIEFHEFLNLLLWCVPDSFPHLPKLGPVKDRNRLGLYHVDDPKTYLVPASKRDHQFLDGKYVNEEMSYEQRQVKPVSSNPRKEDGFDDYISAIRVNLHFFVIIIVINYL